MVKHFKHLCLIIPGLIILIPGGLLSQTKYSALLPSTDKTIPIENDGSLRIAADINGTETSRAFFKFDFSYLPGNAKIGSLNLRLYNLPRNNTANFASQTITVLQGANVWSGNETTLNNPNLSWADIKNNKPIGRDEVKKSTTDVNIKLKIPGSSMYISKFIPANGILSLAARSPEKSQDNKFYSSLNAETPGNFSKKPKLIVTYEVDPYPFRTDWAQASGTAQHNSYLNWRTNAATTIAKARKLPNAANDLITGADPTGAVVIYKNQPIVFTQSPTGVNSVYAVKQLDGNGNVLWSQTVDDVAKCWPLIDEQGMLYYFSLKGKLTVLNLGNSGTVVYSKQLAEITNNQVASINNNVTIGYDGTLYLPTDKSIIALSAFPKLNIRWKYEFNSNELCGQVSLSPNESQAFFISVDKQQGNSRLMMLNNMDGSLLDSSGNILGGYKNDLNYYIPAPVVRDNSAIFVLNGFDNSNQLLFFKLEKNKLSLKETISSERNVNTGISQPVIDDDLNVFFVFNNKMARFDSSKSNKADIYDTPFLLDNASILVTDASSNIYALDPYNGANRVAGFQYGRQSKVITNSFEIQLMPPNPGDGTANNEPDEANRKIGNTRKNLVLAPDQTLYTVTRNNVVAITPAQIAVNDLVISPADIKTNTVYRASNSITVTAANINPSINTIFYSGGTISFKPGFGVIKGAQLLCKTGMK